MAHVGLRPDTGHVFQKLGKLLKQPRSVESTSHEAGMMEGGGNI